MAVKTTRRYVTTVLKQDHKQIQKLFDQYEDLDPGPSLEKQALAVDILGKIQRHADAEEAYLYPEIATIPEADAQSAVQKARAQHQVIHDLMMEIRRLGFDSAELDAKMTVLCENIEHHAKEEEKEVLPCLKRLSKDRQQEVSARIIDRLIGE